MSEKTIVARRTVAELMTPDPVVVSDQAPAARAERLLEEHRITGLPVVDETGAVVGVVSRSDLLHARSHEPFATDWPGLRVNRLMSRPAVTVSGSTVVTEAATLMEEHNVHRLVVLDDARHPVGILSTMDLARALADWSRS